MLLGQHQVIFQIYLLLAFVSYCFFLLLLAIFVTSLSIFEGSSSPHRSILLVSVTLIVIIIATFLCSLILSSLFFVSISISISLMFGILFSSLLGFFALITHFITTISALSFYLSFSSDFSTSLLNQPQRLTHFQCLELFFSSSYFFSYGHNLNPQSLDLQLFSSSFFHTSLLILFSIFLSLQS